MITVPAALQTHFEGTSLTLAMCLQITRNDGTIFRYTDHATSLTVDGDTYSPAGSFKISAIQTNADGTPSNLAVEGYPQDDAFVEDVRIGLFDDADIELYIVNNQDATEYLLYKKGFLSQPRRQDTNLYYFTINGLGYKLNQQVGRLVQEECDARVGDTRCGINIATYTDSGTVTHVTSRRKFRDTSLNKADNYYRYGRVVWTSGNNSGFEAEVYAYASVNDEITLITAMPYDIEVGDDYDIEAGCDRAFQTCIDKFDNAPNHRGFPHIPTEARLRKLSEAK